MDTTSRSKLQANGHELESMAYGDGCVNRRGTTPLACQVFPSPISAADAFNGKEIGKSFGRKDAQKAQKGMLLVKELFNRGSHGWYGSSLHPPWLRRIGRERTGDWGWEIDESRSWIDE